MPGTSFVLTIQYLRFLSRYYISPKHFFHPTPRAQEEEERRRKEAEAAAAEAAAAAEDSSVKKALFDAKVYIHI